MERKMAVRCRRCPKHHLGVVRAEELALCVRGVNLQHRAQQCRLPGKTCSNGSNASYVACGCLCFPPLSRSSRRCGRAAHVLSTASSCSQARNEAITCVHCCALTRGACFWLLRVVPDFSKQRLGAQNVAVVAASLLRPGTQTPIWAVTECVTYLGKVSTTGMQFLSGCTEKPVIELWKKHTLAREDIYPANALLEIRPFQVWLHHLDLKGEATVHMDTFQVARIAYCTADHNVSPNIFAWVYREINDDLSYQMDCHAVECESKLEAKKLAHAMMEAFKKTFHSMKSDGRIHRNSSSEEVSHEFESDDG
ncbi:PREDICTED: PTB-containing, cubilin and LRP1-interacting protein [Phaethon lepturus]|uniref:PTB-containing, cubilin and LRP1-interacting protein n=1 Tax=Phaethon lepturus TaxID=97097 RepID=UPI000530BCA6|nr:PREDICTED: PTB-containing, cubilin and LRP1-interacting protein [Phaethon lepturus]